MNQTQKITIFTMAVFAAAMFAGPIALNSGVNSAFAWGGGNGDNWHHQHHFFFNHNHNRNCDWR